MTRLEFVAHTLIRLAWRYRNHKDPHVRAHAREDIRIAINRLREGDRPDIHRHKCGHTDDEEFRITGLSDRDGCGHVWQHDCTKIKTDKQNTDAHTCPRCGLGPWYLIYRGEEPAAEAA
jgi:hypothetical protein